MHYSYCSSCILLMNVHAQQNQRYWIVQHELSFTSITVALPQAHTPQYSPLLCFAELHTQYAWKCSQPKVLRNVEIKTQDIREGSRPRWCRHSAYHRTTYLYIQCVSSIHNLWRHVWSTFCFVASEVGFEQSDRNKIPSFHQQRQTTLKTMHHCVGRIDYV